MNINIPFLRTLSDLYGRRGEPEASRALALLYWRALLTLAFLLVIGAITYGEWSLMRILKDLGDTPAGSLPPAALNRATLDTTLTTFKTREAEFNVLRAGAETPIADPSK